MITCDFDSLINLSKVLEEQLRHLNAEVEALERNKTKIFEEINFNRHEFLQDCRRFQAAGSQAVSKQSTKTAERRNSKSTLERERDGLILEKQKALEHQRKVNEERRRTLESLRNSNKELSESVDENAAGIHEVRQNLRNLSSNLSQLDSSTEITRLRYSLKTLEEEKAHLEDCLVGLRLQLPKIEGEERQISSRLKIRSAELGQLTKRIQEESSRRQVTNGSFNRNGDHQSLRKEQPGHGQNQNQGRFHQGGNQSQRRTATEEMHPTWTGGTYWGVHPQPESTSQQINKLPSGAGSGFGQRMEHRSTHTRSQRAREQHPTFWQGNTGRAPEVIMLDPEPCDELQPHMQDGPSVQTNRFRSVTSVATGPRPKFKPLYSDSSLFDGHISQNGNMEEESFEDDDDLIIEICKSA